MQLANLTAEETALTLLVAIEGAHAYSAFLPSIFTIRAFEGENKKRDIRAGEVLATAFLTALSLLMAKIIGKPTPLIIGAGTAIVMVGVYEWALAGA